MQAGYVHRKEVHPQAPCRIKTCNLRFETCNPHPGYAKLLVLWKHYCEESNCRGGNRLAELHLCNCKSLFRDEIGSQNNS